MSDMGCRVKEAQGHHSLLAQSYQDTPSKVFVCVVLLPATRKPPAKGGMLRCHPKSRCESHAKLRKSRQAEDETHFFFECYADNTICGCRDQLGCIGENALCSGVADVI